MVSLISLFLLAMGFHCLCLHADEAPKEGFINIDCGAPKDTFDTQKRLFYKSDKDMIRSGISKQLSLEFRERFQPQYSTLRSFPNDTRNCYHLTLDLEEACQNCIKRYLIRTYFVYGNYDGLNFAPTFDLYVGVNLWRSSKFNITYSEIVTHLDPSINYMDVCLVNTNNGVPYISSMDLQPFNISLYGIDPTHSQNVILLNRRNIGSSEQIIYPKDVYDRQWSGFECDFFNHNTSSLRTNASITETSEDDNPYKLPQSMLQTACQSPNSSFPLESYWTSSGEGTFRYYFCFHFAEIEKLKPDQFRDMKIVFNDVYIITNSIKLLQYLKLYTICSKGHQLLPNQDIKLWIFATSSSTLPPILNGLEIFYTSDALNPLTFSQDVNAMTDIKQHYKLSRNWEGDPCQPLAFSWDGLNCSNNGNPWPRVILLNLSNSNLTGDISSSISKLTAINYLDLSNNELEGVIPDSLALLPQLQFLNLSGNKLTGMVPDPLLQKYKDGTLDLSIEGNQELCWSPPCNHHKKKLSYQHMWVWIMVAALITVILCGVALLLLWVIRKRKLNNLEETYADIEDQIQNFSIAPQIQKFGFRELKKATNNFNPTNKLGRGGFGTVYKGNLMNKEVAIKRISKDSCQGQQEFITEVATIGGLHHKNLVRLIGWCYQKKDLLLVYEYMLNGSLDKLTYNGDTNDNFIVELNWETRFNIICGIAEALNYLHNECKKTILHRDIKPSNVMLDSKFEAKLGDFGLARSICRTEQTHHSTREIAGTRGYIAPEIFLTHRATMETDVYAFDILVLEVVCRRKPTNPSGLSYYGGNITHWVWEFHKRGAIVEATDERIEGQYEEEDIERVLILGLACCHPNPHQRPTMKSVLQVLKKEANFPDLPREMPLFVWPLNASSRDDTDNSQQTTNSLTVTEPVGR